MNKKTTILAAAFTLALAGAAQAEDIKMEKCSIVGADGKGLIKAGKADCASENNSCSGTNKVGDPKAWIYIPAGSCEKIQGGVVNK